MAQATSTVTTDLTGYNGGDAISGGGGKNEWWSWVIIGVGILAGVWMISRMFGRKGRK